MKKRILCIGDYNVATGFSNVNTNIFNRLKDDFEIAILASNYNGMRPVFPAYFPVYGTRSHYGIDEMIPAINDFQPDIVYTLQDGYVTPEFAKNFQSLGRKAPTWIAHVVFDGLPVRKDWADHLKYAYKVIFPTDWQKQIFDKQYPHLDTSVIYHGVDTKKYFPLSEKEIAGHKQAMFGDPDVFVFGMVAKNFQRKRYPELIQAFKKFKDQQTIGKRVILFVHADDPNSREQFHLKNICDQCGLSNKDVICTVPGKPMTEERMNIMYNVFDVNCLISIGEGYGLPTNHACACGKSTIACDNSVQKDLSEKTGSMFLVRENDFETYITLDDSYKRRLPDIDNLAYVLETSFQIFIGDFTERESMRENALAFAKAIDWETKIVPQWKKLFEETPSVSERKVMVI